MIVNVNPIVETKDEEIPTLNFYIDSFLCILSNIYFYPFLLIITAFLCFFPLLVSFFGFCLMKFFELILYLMEKYIIDIEEYKKWKKNRQ